MGQIKRTLFGKVIYVNDEGKKSKPYEYIDYTSAWNLWKPEIVSDDRIRIVDAGKHGLRQGAINSQGKEIVKPVNINKQYLKYLGKSKVLVRNRKNEKAKIVDIDGSVEIFDSVEFLDKFDYWSMKKNGAYGLIDADGNVVFECNSKEPISVVAKGVFKIDGKLCFHPQSKLNGQVNIVSEFLKQWAIVENNGRYGVVDAYNGVVIVPCENKTEEIAKEHITIGNGVVIAKRGNKYGALSAETALEVLPFEYDDIYHCGAGYDYSKIAEGLNRNCVLWVVKGNVSGVMDIHGTPLIPCVYENLRYFSGEDVQPLMFKSGKYGKVGVFDANLNTILEHKYDSIVTCDGKFHAKLDGKIGIYDFDGNIELKHKFETSKEYIWFQDGLCPLAINGKYGYVNENYEWVIKPKYDKAEHFDENGYAVVGIKFHLGSDNEERIFLNLIDKNGVESFDWYDCNNRIRAITHVSIEPYMKNGKWHYDISKNLYKCYKEHPIYTYKSGDCYLLDANKKQFIYNFPGTDGFGDFGDGYITASKASGYEEILDENGNCVCDNYTDGMLEKLRAEYRKKHSATTDNNVDGGQDQGDGVGVE